MLFGYRDVNVRTFMPGGEPDGRNILFLAWIGIGEIQIGHRNRYA